MHNQQCQYCGKDTYDVDIDYLVGTDHLSCMIEQETQVQEPSTVLNPDRRLLAVEVDMIKRTPNDQELGAKVRQLFYEVYNS
jgi:hypothetical protein